MEIETFIQNLKLFTKKNEFYDFEFYLYGSSITNKEFIDIDILIIYKDFDDLKKVKRKILKKFNQNLIHIISLTKSEEVELTFINKVKALKIE